MHATGGSRRGVVRREWRGRHPGPPSFARSRVAGLWELADGGASADELLDAVLADGVTTLSDLALVSEADGAVRVLVRGAVTAFVSTPDAPGHRGRPSPAPPGPSS